MFLVANSRAAGLADGGERYHGTYAASWQKDTITGVVAHYWNGNLITQASTHLSDLWREAVRSSGRTLHGLIGPTGQVEPILAELTVAAANIQMDETEYLYSLPLANLHVPEPLQSGRLRGRCIQQQDVAQVSRWRVAYNIEALGAEDGPDLVAQSRANIERSLAEGNTWVLEDAGQLVASTSFNAQIKEAVQVGGVWTPPENRGRGYGRAVVAASLLDARNDGAERAILFTGEENLPARKVYEALGFHHIGDYRLVLFREPISVDA